jgi:hypothetical protein
MPNAMPYHYIQLSIVMRHCVDPVDAVRQLGRLMPYNPDETTKHMESWTVERISGTDCVEYDRTTHSRELELEQVVQHAEGRE